MTESEKLSYFNRLKKERNAVVLAHFYQDDIIQETADVLGDSLLLAQAAKKTNADVILFCGVHFMAETAKILNPEKIVVIPDMEAGCSLSESAEPDAFREWIDEHSDHVVVSYINSSADVKAMSDIICTSSNAVKVVESIPKDKNICFAPDKYLGAYVIRETGRKMVLWDGACMVHETFSLEALEKLMIQYPEAKVLVHGECPEAIAVTADYVGSTNGIKNYAKQSNTDTFIVVTETGLLYSMRKEMPDKHFLTVPNLEGCACNECPHMKKNTLDKMISALESLQPAIEMNEDLRLKALYALDAMLEVS
ncbi:quinolinate synthase NadA [bacterium]|nr:quinolinate synthase NadA [bacterium]